MNTVETARIEPYDLHICPENPISGDPLFSWLCFRRCSVYNTPFCGPKVWTVSLCSSVMVNSSVCSESKFLIVVCVDCICACCSIFTVMRDFSNIYIVYDVHWLFCVVHLCVMKCRYLIMTITSFYCLCCGDDGRTTLAYLFYLGLYKYTRMYSPVVSNCLFHRAARQRWMLNLWWVRTIGSYRPCLFWINVTLPVSLSVVGVQVQNWVLQTGASQRRCRRWIRTDSATARNMVLRNVFEERAHTFKRSVTLSSVTSVDPNGCCRAPRCDKA